MNYQSNYYGYNNSKKSSKTSTKSNKVYIKKSSKPKKNMNKMNLMDQFDNYNNNPYTSAVYSKNKKNLNKMMKDYQLFVKKYLGDTTPIVAMTEERMNKLLEEEEEENRRNILLYDEKNNMEFQKLLKNNKDLDFGEENFIQPSDDEIFYSEIDKLGNHKNNKNDYSRREKLLCKKEVDIEDEEIKKDPIPKTDEKVSPPEPQKPAIGPEYLRYLEEKKEASAKKIQEIFRSKRKKEKLYLGFDSSDNIFLKIYVNEYDEKKKVKSIEIYCLFIKEQRELIFVKTIKELVGKYDSLSVINIKKIMNEIIERIFFQSDEPIDIELLSELDRESEDNENQQNEEKKSEIKINNNEINNNNKENNNDANINNNKDNNNDDNINKENSNDNINNNKENNDDNINYNKENYNDKNVNYNKENNNDDNINKENSNDNINDNKNADTKKSKLKYNEEQIMNDDVNEYEKEEFLVENNDEKNKEKKEENNNDNDNYNDEFDINYDNF